MVRDLSEQIDVLCGALASPLSEIGLISRVLPAVSGAFAFATTPAGRTFVLVSIDSVPPQTLVFFLSESDDGIDIRVIGERIEELRLLTDLIHAEDPEIDGLCTVGLSQLANPVFNFGGLKVTDVSVLATRKPADRERIIGIVLRLPFGIRFGLHVYDDHRLSICFNDVCDAIVLQARRSDFVRVVDRQLNASEHPDFGEIDWFDWLKQ